MGEISSNLSTLVGLAAGDLSANQYEIMRISDATTNPPTINVASEAVSVQMLGVLANKPAAANRHATIVTDGEKFKVRAGGAISSAGLFLTTNGSGRAAAATSGQMVFGRLLEVATANGDIVSYLPVKAFRLSGAIT